MADTITFTPKDSDSYYTLSEINSFFTSLATAINGKLDVRTPALSGALNVGNTAFQNVADGTAGTDAINVRQARSLAGV